MVAEIPGKSKGELWPMPVISETLFFHLVNNVTRERLANNIIQLKAFIETEIRVLLKSAQTQKDTDLGIVCLWPPSNPGSKDVLYGLERKIVRDKQGNWVAISLQLILFTPGSHNAPQPHVHRNINLGEPLYLTEEELRPRLFNWSFMVKSIVEATENRAEKRRSLSPTNIAQD